MFDTELLQSIFLLLNLIWFMENQIEQKTLTKAEVTTIWHWAYQPLPDKDQTSSLDWNGRVQFSIVAIHLQLSTS
jgi:hypothetical protein